MRHYKLEFTTKGPVHVGNGQTLGKRDYFLSNKGTIDVLNAPKFVGALNSEQLKSYCDFLGTDSREGLQDYLEDDVALRKIAQRSVAYSTTAHLARAPRGSYQYLEIAACIKDSLGRPYVPGSSVKGMLRTALLNFLVYKNHAEYQELYRRGVGNQTDRNAIARETARIERKALWTERPDPNDRTVVRDIMRYVSVSDSEPLSIKTLTFAKKYDMFSRNDKASHKRDMGKRLTDRKGNELNIYRECIKPGTTIVAMLDIDERVDEFLPLDLDAGGLLGVLKVSNELYKQFFLNKFDLPAEGGAQGAGTAGGAAASSGDGHCQYVIQSGPRVGKRCPNPVVPGTCYCRIHQSEAEKHPVQNQEAIACYLGGGVGYVNKSITNAVLAADPKRVESIARILYAQFPSRLDPAIKSNGLLKRQIEKAGFETNSLHAQYKRNGALRKGKDDHRHWQDAALGVSPHTLKLGIIGGKKYQMGLCDLRIVERL